MDILAATNAVVAICRVMQGQLYLFKKPVFLLLIAAILALSITSGFLYTEKHSVQELNRQLIIQNDSILSVNILLKDSLKGKPIPAAKILSLGNEGGKRNE